MAWNVTWQGGCMLWWFNTGLSGADYGILVIHNNYHHQEQIILTKLSHQNWNLIDRGAFLIKLTLYQVSQNKVILMHTSKEYIFLSMDAWQPLWEIWETSLINYLTFPRHPIPFTVWKKINFYGWRFKNCCRKNENG